MGHRDAAGVMFHDWHARRRFSQLDLSLAAGVSAKHLSYVETGRSRPSPEMVRHLCEHLEVPLRERNAILLAAGHARAIRSPRTNTPTGEVRGSGRPRGRRPPLPGRRRRQQVESRRRQCRRGSVFLVGVAEHLLAPTTNVMRLVHAEGLRPRVLNFDEYAGHVLARLRRVFAHHPNLR